MAEQQKKNYYPLANQDEVTFSRMGKIVYVKGNDGVFQESDSVEANLLLEILKELRSKKK